MWTEKWIADLPPAEAVTAVLTRCDQTNQPPDLTDPCACPAHRLARTDRAESERDQALVKASDAETQVQALAQARDALTVTTQEQADRLIGLDRHNLSLVEELAQLSTEHVALGKSHADLKQAIANAENARDNALMTLAATQHKVAVLDKIAALLA